MVEFILEVLRIGMRLLELHSRPEDTSAQERYELLRLQSLTTDRIAKSQLKDG